MSDDNKKKIITRRDFLILSGATLGGAALACGRGEELLENAPGADESASDASPTATPLFSREVITANDYVSEQLNFVQTIPIVVNYAGLPDRVFDLREHWDKVFGTEDPLTQLNAYYHENFYGQLQLQPVSTPEMGEKGYVEIVFEGIPQDHAFGYLIGMESCEGWDAVDSNMVQKVILDLMAGTVQALPAMDYQDKFIFAVLNATGAEYGRGAMGAIPGVAYDLFIGEAAEDELDRFSDETTFRILDGGKVIGLVGPTGYTYEDYARDREGHIDDDQFILGMALFGSDAPLSCASHDILHGLRRKSASANPPEGRDRAVNCLYSLPLQSQWLVGTEEHGPFDRSINCTPYIGWWDPMGDHLHPQPPRSFFGSHAHGMCSYTKVRMGFIPDRCLALAEADDFTVKLASLSNPELPPIGSEAEAMVVKVPLMPGIGTLAHIYLLLEYRRRVGGPDERHPDNFTIDPDYVFGEKSYDPGYDPANPAESRYINPPMQFVPDEGVLVYLVNEGMPESPALPYTEWYNFVVALLNPAGNENRDDLTQAALDAGESIAVDFNSLYPDRGVPVTITVEVVSRTDAHAEVHITRERF